MTYTWNDAPVLGWNAQPFVEWKINSFEITWPDVPMDTTAMTVNEVRALRGRKRLAAPTRKKGWVERAAYRLVHLLGTFVLNTWRGFVEVL